MLNNAAQTGTQTDTVTHSLLGFELDTVAAAAAAAGAKSSETLSSLFQRKRFFLAAGLTHWYLRSLLCFVKINRCSRKNDMLQSAPRSEKRWYPLFGQ